MSSDFNYEKLVVESIPYCGSDGKIDLYRVTENSRDLGSEVSFNSNLYENQENHKHDYRNSEPSEICSSFDQASCDLIPGTSDSNRVLIHKLEIEKETWRVESLKNGLKLKEYERIVDDLKAKLVYMEKNPRGPNDMGFVSIQKSEFAEINYHRMMLEKEVSKLKASLEEKEEELRQVRKELQGNEKNFQGVQHSRKASALAVLDGNVMGLRKEGREGEKQDLHKRLHESLRVNDSLTRKIKDLQEKIRSLESEKCKDSPETCYSAKRNSRASSITSFSQLKKYEAEQDLELYIKKYKESVLEIEKLESINNENLKVIETLHNKLNDKKEKFSSLSNSSQSLLTTIKSLEHQLISIKSQKDSETEKNQNEITNLKRALDLVHHEKEQLEFKCRSNEDLKSKLSVIVQSWESSKSNESKLHEEVSKLKSINSSQETQLASVHSRLSQFEFMYQTLESNHATALKSLHEKETSLLGQIEKNSKLSSKVQKIKQKVHKSKSSSQNNFNDFKDMTRNFMAEKQYNEKLAEQNAELRFMVKSLEENREKLLAKNEELGRARSELAAKLSSFEQSAFEKLSSLNSLKEDQEKCVNELNSVRFEYKKKNEDFIMAKSETRKVMTDVADLTSKLKKSLEQEEFLQKLIKGSENEIKRLSDKIMSLNSQLEDRENRFTGVSAELVSTKAQLNVFSADLKKIENSYRLLNIENYTLQSKIDELDKIRLEPGNEATFKEEYFKLVRAYQHLNEELSITRANVAQSKSNLIDTVKSSNKDPALVEAHLESLQIKLEGALDEKVSMERRIEFLGLEKAELEKTIQKLKEELEMKDRKIGNGEKYLVEIQKYKSEIRRLENEHEKLKHELCIALNKVNSVQKWAKGIE